MAIQHWSEWSDKTVELYGEVLQLIDRIKFVKDYQATEREFDIIEALVDLGDMQKLENDMVGFTEKGVKKMKELEDAFHDYQADIQVRQDEDMAESYYGSSREECSNCRGGGCYHCRPQDYL